MCLGLSSKKSDLVVVAGEDILEIEVDSSSLVMKLKDTDLCFCLSL